MDITNFISNLGFGDSLTMWIIFAVAAVRGLAATASEVLPDRILGPFASIINAIGANTHNASGSQ